jgi:hypothetical protein
VPQLQLGLTLVSLVGKLAYSYDLGAWGFLEGMMNARSHPNILFWNITRFNPFYCMLEVSFASRQVSIWICLRAHVLSDNAQQQQLATFGAFSSRWGLHCNLGSNSRAHCRAQKPLTTLLGMHGLTVSDCCYRC